MDNSFGLVFAGGGGKGAWQLGVWKALDQAGIRGKAVSGTSVGALNTLKNVISDLEKKAQTKTDAIEKCLTTTMENFVNQLIGDLKADSEKLSVQLKDKEASLTHLKSLYPVATEIEEKLKNLL